MTSNSDKPATGEGPEASAARAANPVEQVIAAFGGIRPMAAKLSVPVTTVQGWKKRGAIPAARHEDILKSASEHDVVISSDLLESASDGSRRNDSEASAAGSAARDGGQPSATGSPEQAKPPPATPPSAPARSAEDSRTAVQTKAEDSMADRKTTGSATSGPGSASPGSGETTTQGAKASVASGASDQPAGPTGGNAPPDSPAGKAAGRETDTGNSAGPPVSGAGDNGDDGGGRRGGVAVVIAVIALLIAIAAVAAPYWFRPAVTTLGLPQPAADQAGSAVADLRGDVEDLAATVSELDQRLDEVGNGAAGVSEDSLVALEDSVAQQVAGVTDRLDTLDNRLERAEATTAELTDLDAVVERLRESVDAVQEAVLTARNRIDSMETRFDTIAANSSSIQALVLATGQLRAAIQTAGGFAGELATIRALGGTDPELESLLDDLAPHAATGIPTMGQLSDRLDAIAGEIVQASREGEDADWVDDALHRLSSLVTVRRAPGEATGDRADAVVARAQARMVEGDIEQAVSEIRSLSGAAARTAEPWLVDAEARLLADRIARALTDITLHRLSGQAGSLGDEGDGEEDNGE